jgi:hypothetical protein
MCGQCVPRKGISGHTSLAACQTTKPDERKSKMAKAKKIKKIKEWYVIEPDNALDFSELESEILDTIESQYGNGMKPQVFKLVPVEYVYSPAKVVVPAKVTVKK